MCLTDSADIGTKVWFIKFYNNALKSDGLASALTSYAGWGQQVFKRKTMWPTGTEVILCSLLTWAANSGIKLHKHPLHISSWYWRMSWIVGNEVLTRRTTGVKSWWGHRPYFLWEQQKQEPCTSRLTARLWLVPVLCSCIQPLFRLFMQHWSCNY